MLLGVANYFANQQPSTTVNLNPIIAGNDDLFYFSLSSVCSLPGMQLLFPQLISGCPYLRLSEYTNQQIPLTITINNRILIPNQPVAVSSKVQNSSQRATLVLTISGFGKIASASRDISNINVPGSTVVQESGIPIQQLFADITVEAFNFVLDFQYLLFQVSFNSTTTLNTAMTQYVWFSGGKNSAAFKWANAGFEQNATLPFTGGASTINVYSLLDYNQSWNSSFAACTTALFIAKTCGTLFNSAVNTSFQNSTIVYRFYEVNINSTSGGNVFNNKTAWYLSGYRLRLNTSSNLGYSFVGYHYDNGTLISNDSNYILTITSPLNITASFVAKPQSYFWDYFKVFGLLAFGFGCLLALLRYAIRSIDKEEVEVRKTDHESMP